MGSPAVGPAALLVVDMTEYLCNPRYSSSFPTATEAVGQIVRLLEVARNGKVPVIFTRGGKRYFISSSVPMPECQRGSWYWKNGSKLEERWRPEDTEHAMSIAAALAPRPDEPVIFKTKPSAFFGSPLQSYLTALGVRTLFIVGAVTSGCIRATVTDAFSHNYRVILPAEALADSNPRAHAGNLEDMDRKLGWVMEMTTAMDMLATLAPS